MEFWGNLSIPVHALQIPTIACCDLMGFLCSSDILGPIRVTIGFSLYVVLWDLMGFLCSSDILGPIRVTIGFSLYVVLRSVQHGFLLMFYHLRVRIYLFCAAVRPLDYFPCLDDMWLLCAYFDRVVSLAICIPWQAVLACISFNEWNHIRIVLRLEAPFGVQGFMPFPLC